MSSIKVKLLLILILIHHTPQILSMHNQSERAKRRASVKLPLIIDSERKLRALKDAYDTLNEKRAANDAEINTATQESLPLLPFFASRHGDTGDDLTRMNRQRYFSWQKVLESEEQRNKRQEAEEREKRQRKRREARQLAKQLAEQQKRRQETEEQKELARALKETQEAAERFELRKRSVKAPIDSKSTNQ